MEAKGIRLQGELGISRQTIAQGMPACLGCTCMLVCVFLHTIPHETPGAASTRHSLHPPFSKEGSFQQTSGAVRRENAESYLRKMGRAQRNPSPVVLMGIAALHPSYDPPVIGAKRSNPFFRCAARWIASLRSQ